MSDILAGVSSARASVVAVSLSPVHGFSKQPQRQIEIVAGHGVQGDAHAGAQVQHLYRVRKNPRAPNLCQVHLLHEELFIELAAAGISLGPGEIGENVLVRGVDLLTLPAGAIVHMGRDAAVEITGLREPCQQMNRLRPGLMKACLAREADGTLLRKAGVMGRALASGIVSPGDAVEVELPPKPWREMGPV